MGTRNMRLNGFEAYCVMLGFAYGSEGLVQQGFEHYEERKKRVQELIEMKKKLNDTQKRKA